MSHKIIIIARVKDDADYEVILDNLADFPEVISASRIIPERKEEKT